MKIFGTKFILSILLTLIISIVGCEKEEDDKGNDPSVYQYPTATISHNGFDFSGGISDTVNWENNDGETVMWQPGYYGTHPDYPNNDEYIWWRNSYIDTVNYKNQTKDMGIVALSTVTQFSGAWDTVPGILPLLAGHTIIAKCRDGYVKFEVISADTSAIWPALVKYYFSESTTFEH